MEEPQLPRVRRRPRWLDDGADPHVFACPKDRFKQIYCQAIDECLGALDERFKSQAFLLAANIETTVVNAAEGKSFDLSTVTEHFGTDLNSKRLELHLSMLSDLIGSEEEGKVLEPRDASTSAVEEESGKKLTITNIVKRFRENSTWRQMLSEVNKLLTLFLCIPVTSCTAERSFSTLRRLKTFLRSTMSQERLNHVAILHVHKELTDQLDLSAVCNDFIDANEMRRTVFAKF